MTVEIQQLNGRGRGLVTTAPVQGGSAILVEAPLILTVSQDYKDAACANCLRLLAVGAGEASADGALDSSMPSL